MLSKYKFRYKLFRDRNKNREKFVGVLSFPEKLLESRDYENEFFYFNI